MYEETVVTVVMVVTVLTVMTVLPLRDSCLKSHNRVVIGTRVNVGINLTKYQLCQKLRILQNCCLTFAIFAKKISSYEIFGW